MDNEPIPLLIPVEKKKRLWPTLLDYAILILLAVIVGNFTVYYLTQSSTKKFTTPYSKLLDVTKP